MQEKQDRLFIVFGVAVFVVVLVLVSILLWPAEDPIGQEIFRPAVVLDQVEIESLTKTDAVFDQNIIISQGWVVNPTTGDRQSVRLYIPRELGVWPLAVLVPGGTGDGTSFELPSTHRIDELSDAALLASKGFVVVVYSPLGTGQSEGELNYQGYDDQDGLAAIISAVAALPNVDQQNIGLVSTSYGVTGAAGVLARYPNLGVKYWSDWEGPSSRVFTTINCKGSAREVSPANLDCEDDTIWEQREAATFIQTLSVDYYWRIQQVTDHVQPGYGHTREMVNNAVENSHIPWVKLNDGEVNATYATDAQVPAVANMDHFAAYIVPHVVEMSKMN